MAIVGVLDFEAKSTNVPVVSALLASRLKTSCHLAQSTGEPEASAAHRARAAWVAARLEDRAERVRALAVDVHAHVLPGPATSEIGALARSTRASLIVTQATARVAEQTDDLLRHTRLPVLVVREAAHFVRWAAELRPLRILAVSAEVSELANLVRMVKVFAEAAACAVQFLHVTRPDDARRAEQLRHALEKRAAGWSLRIESPRGSAPDQVLAVAAQFGAHLVVVGSRIVPGVSPQRMPSLPRRVLVNAPSSVLCLPVGGGSMQRRPLYSVLAATDLTPAGDAALALASRVVAQGGVVHAVHVLTESDEARAENGLAHLAATARGLGVGTARWQFHVLRGEALAPTLRQAAQQLAVDAVCVARGPHDLLAMLMAEIDCALLVADLA